MTSIPMARKTEDGRLQTLDAHLRGVAARSRDFAGKFGCEELGDLQGFLHDLGKLLPDFQRKLLDDADIRVHHAMLGAAFAQELFESACVTSHVAKFLGRVLAYTISSHHAGLPDFGKLLNRLSEGLEDRQKLETQILKSFVDATIPKTLPTCITSMKTDGCHLWIRMLFSCLVDADRLDAEAFVDPIKCAARGTFSSIESLCDKLNRFLDELASKAAATPVNALRAEVLEDCLKAALKEPGLFSLTVPTGGGKTLSSLAFALRHAIEHSKLRVIYVVPFTTIIEQTVNVFRHVLGADAVVEHHSNIGNDKDTERNRMAAENWDAPVIVTTNVQFFESLFATKPSRCRKLHNIVNSVVILDEAQTINLSLRVPIVHAMNLLVDSFGCTLVLCTATQPSLPGTEIAREIVPDPKKLFGALKRVRFEMPPEPLTPSSWVDIAARLQLETSVLCIVNRRQDCYELHSLMPPGTLHLSTLMCGAHRSQVIDSIRERLKRGESVRVVSTQLIEAGVDIDFPVVFRALGGIDSVAQAGGRCNREGLLSVEGRVVVFVPPKAAPRGLLRKGEDVTKELLALGRADPQSPEIFGHYFSLLMGKANENGKEILDKLRIDGELRISFEEAAKAFRMIEDDGKSVLVSFGDGERLIERVRRGEWDRNLLRRMQRFTVSLPEHIHKDLIRAGAVEELAEVGLSIQCNSTFYLQETGLRVFDTTTHPEDFIL